MCVALKCFGHSCLHLFTRNKGIHYVDLVLIGMFVAINSAMASAGSASVPVNAPGNIVRQRQTGSQ